MTTTGIDHQENRTVEEAARRVADQPQGSVLTAVEAYEAASQAEKLARRTGAV